MTKKQPATLREVAQAALDAHPGASGRELERIARKKDLTISFTTINALAAGTYKSRPSKRTLDALAELAGVDVDLVREVAGVPIPGPSFAEELPPGVDNLTPRQRSAVVTVIRAFLADGRADEIPDATVIELPDRKVAEAARETGKLSKGQQRRLNAERAGEPEADNPEDFEPR